MEFVFSIVFNFLIYIVHSQVWAKPNVLFIVIDDLRPNLGVYGCKNAHTPNIDKLASKSFLFRNVFAQQAICAPSRNSFLTSRRPDSLHLYDFYSYWRHEVGNFTTLPQHFKENGYFTHSIGKVFHPGISSNFSDDMPYSWSTNPFHPKTVKYMNAKVCANSSDATLENNLLCPVIPELQPGSTLPDLESLNAALDFLRYRKEITNGLPYFLAVGFHKPHVPLKFPIQYLDYHPIDEVILPNNRWRPPLMPTVAWNPWTDIRLRHDVQLLNISFPFGVIPDDFIKKITQHYNAAVTYVDNLVGQILNKVDKNTIIVLTSDHGWSIGEHGEYSKFSNFDVATKVPLLIHMPDSNIEIISDHIVELVDLFPTLVDLTKVSQPLPLCELNTNSKLCTEGKSLVILMKKMMLNQDVSKTYTSFSQYPRPGTFPTKVPNSDKPRLHNIKIMGYSMRNQQYRYTEWVNFNYKSCKPDWSVLHASELYDHTIDPNENLNLVSRTEMANITKALSRQLKLGWRHENM